MITAPFWTHSTHAFKDDKYVCSVCGYVSEKPYPDCPGCGSMMTGSRYASEWIDEAEKSDLFLEEEENVASRLTVILKQWGRIIKEALRKVSRSIRDASIKITEGLRGGDLPYSTGIHSKHRIRNNTADLHRKPGRRTDIVYDHENYENALRLLADLSITKMLHDKGALSDSRYIEEIDERLNKVKTR